jgi:hypothetical protein
MPQRESCFECLRFLRRDLVLGVRVNQLRRRAFGRIARDLENESNRSNARSETVTVTVYACGRPREIDAVRRVGARESRLRRRKSHRKSRASGLPVRPRTRLQSPLTSGHGRRRQGSASRLTILHGLYLRVRGVVRSKRRQRSGTERACAPSGRQSRRGSMRRAEFGREIVTTICFFDGPSRVRCVSQSRGSRGFRSKRLRRGALRQSKWSLEEDS